MAQNRKRRNILVDGLYREIVFQSYVGARLTGLPTAQVDRIIRSGLRSKYILAGVYGFTFLGITFSTLMLNPYGRLIFPLEAFIWVFLLVFIPTLQLSYGASAGGQIRELLETLPMSARQIEGLAAKAIAKTLDAPLLSAFLVLSAGGLLFGPLLALSSILAGLCALSLALAASLLLMHAFRRLGSASRFGSAFRMVVVTPFIFFLVVTSYVSNLKLGPISPAMVYAPILSFVGASAGIPQALALSLGYTLLFAAAGYRSFVSASTLLLSPLAGQSTKFGRFKIKVRSQLASIVITDLRQVVRSPRLIGFFFTPLVFVAILVYDMYFGGGVGRLGFDFVYLQDIVPFVFAISYMPYVLYLGELRGYSYFKILPVKDSVNVLSKMLTTLLVFFGLGSAMAYAAYIPLRDAYVFASVYLLALPLVSSVLLTTVYFHYSIAKMSMGVAGTLTSIVFTVANIVVLGVPVGFYYAGLLFGLPRNTSVIYLCVSALAEMAVLLFVEKRVRG